VRCSRQACPRRAQTGGRVELDADRVLATVAAGVADVLGPGDVSGSSIEAVGLASQSNTFVLLAAHGGPVMPMICWLDERARQEAEELLADFGRDTLFHSTGLPTLVGQMLLCKLVWLKRHGRPLLGRARQVLLIHDYLVRWLTGAACTDASLWSLTGLLDVRQRRWWPRAMETLDLKPDQLPALDRPGERAGELTSQAAAQLGLQAGTPVAVGSLDQLTGAIAAGNGQPGDVCETTGTALCAMQTLAEFPQTATGSWVGPHALADRFYHLFWNERGTIWLEAVRKAHAAGLGYDRLEAAAAATPPGSNGWFALAGRGPSGASLPQMIHKQRRGGPDIGPAVRAVMEAVAFELYRMLERLCAGRWPSVVRSLGGGARSDAWLQIKADMLGIPIERLACEEPTSLGAAMYAAVTAGWFDSLEAAMRAWARPGRRFEPDAERKARYDHWREEYRQMTQAPAARER